MTNLFSLCVAPMLAVFLVFALYVLLSRQRSQSGAPLAVGTIRLQFAMMLLLLGVTLIVIDIIKH